MIATPILPALALVLALPATPGQAGPARSPVPPLRPADAGPAEAPAPMARTAPRPRPESRNPEAPMPAAEPVDPAFAAWLDDFRARARAAGIADRTLEAALTGLAPLPGVIERDRSQGEFTLTLAEYLDRVVDEGRVRAGRAAMADKRALLARIEAAYGVPAGIVAAIWGVESDYGATRGDLPVIDALATLAHDGRRGRFFEAQLIDALRIVEAGDVAPSRMRGSWAGAMGHTQFIPASYRAHAVDFDGDGRRDIWGDDPTDALASTAAYLAAHGWTRGQPWGLEVRLPRGFEPRLAGRGNARAVQRWSEMGVRPAGGGTLPEAGEAAILMPEGADGRAFLILDNFAVIRRYNPADFYVIAVGLLSDRLRQ